MGDNTEGMIKKAISETIVEELFRDLGFFVLKLGQENTINPITQLEKFIKTCDGKFKLKRNYKLDCLKQINYASTMPDFLIVHKDGDLKFIEVKYRCDGCLYPEDYLVFYTFPLVKVFVICLSFDVELTSKEYYKDNIKDEYKSTNFHIHEIIGKKVEGKDELIITDDMINKKNVEISTLKHWLKEDYDIRLTEIIHKYEKLVDKWIINTREN